MHVTNRSRDKTATSGTGKDAFIDSAARHFEQYVHLADVTPEAALISWGGFWFRLRDGGGGDHVLVDDVDLHHVARQRHETVGARSSPFGHAAVEVRDTAGNLVSSAETKDANHVWLEGLAPDTEYTYRVAVDGEPWADGERMDWRPDRDGTGGRLERRGRRYSFRFRTAPAPEEPVPLTFAVIGDFGFGVRTSAPDAEHQRQVARALERTVEERDVRLVLTTGDNIYLGREATAGATGDEDDDWFFTFYQPYRYILDHIPFYPSVGNHDSSDEERSDDRAQVSDNFFLEERFRKAVGTERSSLDPGLFYSFRFGRDIEFVALDTTKASELEESRFYNHPRHVRFLDETFPDRDGTARSAPRWSFPFMHHPPLCAGPHHRNTTSLRDRLLPLAKRAGVRLVLSGHEHNFQYSLLDGIHFIITGAAGKVRRQAPRHFDDAHTRGWAGEAHFLLVEVDSDEARLTPMAGCEEGRGMRPVDIRTPTGERMAVPILVRHDRRNGS